MAIQSGPNLSSRQLRFSSDKWYVVRCRHPFHIHTNPFQIVGLNNSWLNPNTTWTSWFEVCLLG